MVKERQKFKRREKRGDDDGRKTAAGRERRKGPALRGRGRAVMAQVRPGGDLHNPQGPSPSRGLYLATVLYSQCWEYWIPCTV